MTKQRRVYGITELAAAIGVKPVRIRQWLYLGYMDLPEPTERLARGAVWIAEDVAQWIEQMRTR